MYSYTVRCRFTNPTIASRWLQWLKAEHIQAVLDAGAISADVFEMTDGQLEYEIRYEFESQDAFEKYNSEKAPALREEGLQKFPLNLGLDYTRSTGKRVLSSSNS